MKKLILILIFLAGFSQLKAQQTIIVQRAAPLTNGLTNTFKSDTSIAPNQFLIQPDANSTTIVGGVNKVNTVVYSNMPVAHVSSNDRMPIAKLQSNEHYNMPMLKVTVKRPGDLAQTPAP
jgi:hypothetical protein